MSTESGISLLYDLDFKADESDLFDNAILYSRTAFGKNAEVNTSSQNPNFDFSVDKLFSSGKHGCDSRIDPRVLNYLFKYILGNIQYLQRGGAFFHWNETMNYDEGAIVLRDDENEETSIYRALSVNGPDSIKGVIDPLQDKTGTWVPFVQTLIDQVTSDSEMNLIRNKISSNRTDINALNSTVSELLLNVQENTKTLAENSDKINKINVDINNLDLSNKNNENSILDLNTKVKNNTNEIEDNALKLNVFENKQTEFSTILQTYEIRIKQLEDYIAILRNGPKDESGTN